MDFAEQDTIKKSDHRYFNIGGIQMEEKELKKIVYQNFGTGFHCAEVVAKTVLELYSDKPHSDVIRAASGFGGGIAGTTEELCGAFTGGVITLGYFFGRENPGEELSKGGMLIKEFKKKFYDDFGSLSCSEILNTFSEEEGQMGCVRVTAGATVMVANMLKEFEEKNAVSVEAACCQPREKVELGNCPFNCGCG
ncbi:MAG: C_GCAxxG_C_C family protein [Candidatus Lokiarchaeota archaeon]|nr:C_GCAxxG_C_C family protein [Candidatus Lokiarchaeota archaeon]